jgi:hypothetical protein
MLAAFPALYLYQPNADSFVRRINLTNNQRVEIGRQSNARTFPAENNGYFDSKVLSRQHAAVWEEAGKVCACLAVGCVYADELVGRSSSRTSKASMGPSSMANDSARRVSRASHTCSSQVTSSYVPSFLHKSTHHFAHRNSESTS